MADELDACTTKPKVAVLVHAVKHAYDTVLDLNQMFDDDDRIYKDVVDGIIHVASVCVDAAPGASAAARTALENLVHVSAFAVRVVACVYAYKISREPVPECVKSVVAIFENFNIDTPVTITAERLVNISKEINSAIKSLKRNSPHGGRPRSRRRSRKQQRRTLKKKNISRKPKYSRRSRRSRRCSYSRKNSSRRRQ